MKHYLISLALGLSLVGCGKDESKKEAVVDESSTFTMMSNGLTGVAVKAGATTQFTVTRSNSSTEQYADILINGSVDAKQIGESGKDLAAWTVDIEKVEGTTQIPGSNEYGRRVTFAVGEKEKLITVYTVARPTDNKRKVAIFRFVPQASQTSKNVIVVVAQTYTIDAYSY